MDNKKAKNSDEADNLLARRHSPTLTVKITSNLSL